MGSCLAGLQVLQNVRVVFEALAALSRVLLGPLRVLIGAGRGSDC